jgi:hypothetical protein
VAIAILTGVLALLAALVGNFVQGRYNYSLEQSKAESALILRAIETGDRKEASQNLLFLLDLGLISDPKHKIEVLRKNPEQGPVLPSRQTLAFPKRAITNTETHLIVLGGDNVQVPAGTSVTVYGEAGIYGSVSVTLNGQQKFGSMLRADYNTE